MVNTNRVNAHIACSNHARFCEYLLVLGRFLLFKNPVKYNRIFEINQRIASCEWTVWVATRERSAIAVCYGLTPTQDFCAILLQTQKAAYGPGQTGPEIAGSVNNGLHKWRQPRGSEATGHWRGNGNGQDLRRRIVFMASPPIAAPRGPAGAVTSPGMWRGRRCTAWLFAQGRSSLSPRRRHLEARAALP